jgi:hypothetical protein
VPAAAPAEAASSDAAQPIVELDGQLFSGRVDGFDAPLRVAAPDGRRLALQPWTYAEHMAALRDAVQGGGDGLTLDAGRFARRVLAASGLAAEEWLAPLALWWAAGGMAAPPTTAAERVALGAGRDAVLRPWTEGERLAALSDALVIEDGEPRWLDAAGYLDAMVRSSVVALDPKLPVDTLDSFATARLLAAVVAHNVHDAAADPLLSAALPIATRQRTLALCRALGWTPAQVLAAPSAEVQRLAALLAEGAPATAGLPGQPGAVVIRFAEDAP